MSLFILLFCAYLTITSSVGVVAQDFYWKDYTRGDVPSDAYQGAPGLYIGQVKTKEHNIVANIYPSPGHAVTVYNDSVLIIEKDIKIFCSGNKNKFYWENVDFDKPEYQQLQDAVRGSYDENTLDPLFIGKVLHQGEWKIGNVHSFKHKNNKGLWVWNQQQQPVNIHQFLILKYGIMVPDNNQDAVIDNFYWRDYIHGDIPCDALQVAPGKYIGQILFSDQNIVATIYTKTGTAVAAFDGKKTTKDAIKILCSPNNHRFYWENVDFDKGVDKHLNNLVKGGFQDPNLHNALYIGKVVHEGEWKVGKVHGNEYAPGYGLWIWDKSENQVNIHQFYLLKYNATETCQDQCNIYV